MSETNGRKNGQPVRSEEDTKGSGAANRVVQFRDGKVSRIKVKAGESVEQKQALLSMH